MQRLSSDANPIVKNNVEDPRDRDGLSLTVSSMCEAEELADKFSTCFGIASLHIGTLLDLGLNVIVDPEDNTKVLVTNLPYEGAADKDSEFIVGEVAKTTRMAARYDPPRKRPKP